MEGRYPNHTSIRYSNSETRKPLYMMSYESNLVVNFLHKNSILTQFSKSSKSIYFYFREISFRYSNHITYSPKERQIQIIRKSKGVWILFPGDKEFTKYNEKTGYYFLRRFIRDLGKTSGDNKNTIRYKKWKSWDKERRRVKKFLHGLSGMSKKDLKNYRLKSPDSLIYVEERLYLK